ncbi:MAG: PqqD family protein [Deltaproteobacteria bacterium]|nr:PqqD family protein [Deltaproteobacteria bacterium]
MVIVLDRQIVHTLNAVGMRVFDLADGRSTDEIAQALIGEFDVSQEQAHADVDIFVQELLGLGALEEVEQGDPA